MQIEIKYEGMMTVVIKKKDGKIIISIPPFARTIIENWFPEEGTEKELSLGSIMTGVGGILSKMEKKK
jgi:hypothetical protein